MRTIQDRNLEVWEAYASSGDFGFPEHSKIVFHNLTDRFRRARVVERKLGKAGVENELAVLSDSDLQALLDGADELK